MYIHYRKDLQNLGAMETTLLYILHWILLDSAEECADSDGDINNPFYYLFSIPTMTVIIIILRKIHYNNNNIVILSN